MNQILCTVTNAVRVRGLVAETADCWADCWVWRWADCWVLFALELCSEDSGTWVRLASTISSSECSVSGDWSLLSVMMGVSESWSVPLHDLTCRTKSNSAFEVASTFRANRLWRFFISSSYLPDGTRPEGQSNDYWQRLQKVSGCIWLSGGDVAHTPSSVWQNSRLNDLPQNWQENPSMVFFPSVAVTPVRTLMASSSTSFPSWSGGCSSRLIGRSLSPQLQCELQGLDAWASPETSMGFVVFFIFIIWKLKKGGGPKTRETKKCSVYSFSRSCPKTVSRTREVFPTGSTTLLRLQLWRTRDCAHRSRHFFFFFFLFWRERCLPMCVCVCVCVCVRERERERVWRGGEMPVNTLNASFFHNNWLNLERESVNT